MKSAIVTDNYKVEKYKAELKKKNFTKVMTSKFGQFATTITVKTETDQTVELKKLCEQVEFYFQTKNN